MCFSILGISKASSISLMMVLLVVPLSNGLLQASTGLASHKAANDCSTEYPGNQKRLESPQDRSLAYIDRGELYADLLPPNGSKWYVMEASEESLVSLFFEPEPGDAVLDVEAEGPVNRTRFDVVWLPAPYSYYVSSKSEIRFAVTNPQPYVVNYRFYVDVSEPLGDSGSKALYLRGGKAAFYLDLRKDDRVLLKLSPIGNVEFRIWVFTLYYEILPETTYKLRIHKQSLYGSVYFPADQGGRYHVIIDSVEGGGEFSLTSSVFSPPWNQEWFWLGIFSASLLVPVWLIDIKKIKGLLKAELFALISSYSWYVTIGLSLSFVGTFSYGTSVYAPLFYLLLFSLGLSHVLQIYASHLDRKITSKNCPNCRRKVNLKESNYCCGRIVKNVSDAWFVLPLSLGLFFFTVSYLVLIGISSTFLGNSLWAGSCGSLIGGVTAWWINKDIYGIRLWKQDPKRYYIPGHVRFMSVGLLTTGILFAVLSPLLVGILLEVFLTQHVESFLPAHAPWIRVRVAPLTLSPQVVLGSAFSAIASGFAIAYRIRKILASHISEQQEQGDR